MANLDATPWPVNLSGTTEVDNVTVVETTPRPWYDRDDLFIHPHWWKYNIDEIPSEHFYLIGLYIGAVGIVGTFGNALVIFTYFK